MSHVKIFLAKLAQGAIGEENSYFLGALLVSKIHQLVMGRQEIRESERKNFYLHIDEFQNFITPTMASILSGARKYKLGLTLAHQELRQLWIGTPRLRAPSSPIRILGSAFVWAISMRRNLRKAFLFSHPRISRISEGG